MKRTVYIETKNYTVFPIVYEDQDDYIRLQRELKGEHTLFLSPVCRDLMWEQVLTDKTTKTFSIFDKSNEYCRMIELQNCDTFTPEIGINLLENKRGCGIAQEIIPKFIEYADSIMQIDYFVVKIFASNFQSRHVFEKMGAQLIGVENSANAIGNVLRKYFCKENIKQAKQICEEVLEREYNAEKKICQYKMYVKDENL